MSRSTFIRETMGENKGSSLKYNAALSHAQDTVSDLDIVLLLNKGANPNQEIKHLNSCPPAQTGTRHADTCTAAYHFAGSGLHLRLAN